MAHTIQEATTIYAPVVINGTLTGTFTFARTYLAQETTKAYPLELQDWRVWDAFQTALGTAASDDLGITAGAFATGCPYITTGDCKTLTATRYARTMFTLPPEYVAGGNVSLRFASGMVTTVASTSSVLDAECYLSARNVLKSGSDLVSTAATSINSLVFAETVFTVTGTSLSPGDTLGIRANIAIVDGATGTAVIGAIAHAEALLTIRG